MCCRNNFLLKKVVEKATRLSHIYLSSVQKYDILIRQNANIRSILANGKEHNISQFADDKTLGLDGSLKSLFVALDTFILFHIFQNCRVENNVSVKESNILKHFKILFKVCFKSSADTQIR